MIPRTIATEILTPSHSEQTRSRFERLRDPGARLWLCLLTYAVGYCLWRTLANTPQLSDSLANRLAFVVPSALVTILAIRAAAVPGIDAASRRAWRLLAAAFGSIGLGYLLWVASSLAPGPFNLGHIGWLLYYPALVAGILSFPRPARSRTERLQFVIDTASVVCGGAMLLVYFFMVSGPRALAEPRAISLAYPAGDLLLLMSVAVLGLRRRNEPARLAFLLLTIELLVEFAGDIAYGATGLYGGWRWDVLYDSAYMLGHLLRGAAALVYARRAVRSAPRAAEDDASTGVSLMPYGFALLGYMVLFLDLGSAHPVSPRLLAGGAVILTALALLSQWITALDNVRLQARSAARRSEARFRTLVQNASDVIAVVDEHSLFLYVAPSAEGTLAVALDSLPGRPFGEIAHPDDLTRARVFLGHAALQLGVSGPCEMRIAAREGRWLPMEAIATNLLADPEISGIVVTLRDISERKRFEEQLLHRALHDPLTGLANRALFADRLRHAHNLSQRSQGSYAVAVADLDDFKAINDGLGHAVGDQVLAQIGRRVRDAVRPIDTAARLGGDEFAVIFEDAGDETATLALAQQVLDAICEPFELARRPTRLTACLGVARSSPGLAEDEVLRQADLALYHAKEHGKGRLAAYAPGMHSEILRRHHLETELRDAIARDELHLLYQPVVSLRSGKAVGVEALVRWRHPTRGLVEPADFIDLAESSGLIEPLGRWVLRRACVQAAQWNLRHAPGAFFLGINLSVRQLLDPAIVSDVSEALTQSGLSPDRLVLEITETLLASDSLAATARLQELKLLGVRLALDDFGTGYSSLGRLRELPIDILKIDGTFSRDLDSREGSSLVQAIVYLGQALGLRVIGEGVETSAQADALQRLGCDLAQGFHFGRPLEPDAIADLIGV